MSAVFRFRSVPADWSRSPTAQRAPARANAEASALRVSVVVTTSGRLPQLMRCLQALLAQTVDTQGFEILVVDQARDKATRRAVQALARTLAPHLLHYLRPLDNGRGTAAARNRGWRAARAPLIAFTDESAVPDPAWLLEGDKVMHAQRWVALAGRVLVQRAGDGPPRRPDSDAKAPKAAPGQPLVLDSANVFVWRKALHAVGGFDDRFPDPAHEDADLQFRLQREGPIGSGASVLVVHPPPGDEGWAEPLRWQHDRFFDALLYREHPRQYRRHRGHAGAVPPWGSYAVVALALAALAALLAGSAAAAQLLAAGSAAGIVGLALRRLQRAAPPPGRWLQVLATSALIPFLAVYWRLRGAWHYRVWFV